jgi:hypothetical protein
VDGDAIVLKEIDIEATLEDCRALINQINAGLSAEEPFVDVSSAKSFCFVLSVPLLLSKGPCHARESGGKRRSSPIIAGAEGPAPASPSPC